MSLSFKDDRIFRHLHHGTGLRTNRIAFDRDDNVCARMREREKGREGKGDPSSVLVFMARYFHFQRTAIQGPRDFLRLHTCTRVLLRLLSRCLTLLPRLTAQKTNRDLGRNTRVCAIRGLIRIEPRKVTERGNARDFCPAQP